VEETKKEKKGFIARFLDKMDKKLEGKSKSKPCCCCDSNKSGDKKKCSS